MRCARCAGHGHTRAKAESFKPRGDLRRHCRLAAEKMIAAGCLQHHAICTMQGDQRTIAPEPAGQMAQGQPVRRAVDFLMP